MKTLIVFAHPEPKSFNGSLFRTAQETLQGAGHEVRTSDLYSIDVGTIPRRRNGDASPYTDFIFRFEIIGIQRGQ